MNAGRHRHTRIAGRAVSLSRRGLTLIEVLVVITILAVLASVLVVNYRGTLGGSKQKIAKQEILKLQDLLEQYSLETGGYPDQQEGLTALTKPLPGHSEPLLSGKILDPWKHPYVYVYPGNHGKFDLISYGADGAEGGTGENADVVSWDVESTSDTSH